MPKKNVGVNLDEEGLAKFEKNRDEGGFGTNAEFIIAKCVESNSSVTVGRPGESDQEPELELPEERRRRLRISNVIGKSLPISALSAEELKLYNLVLDAILKTHKVDQLTHGRTNELVRQFEPKYRVDPAPSNYAALPEKAGLLYCFEASCDQAWEPQFRSSRRDHMMKEHGWNTDKLISVGDL